jgi:methylated-DNA-[protein]-cysteine S-methyltransferase
LVVPCHRIVRSDSTLGGYAGGPEVKQQLLKLEGASLF